MDKKVILVTGASAGIGKASALALINAGHIVYGAARRIDKMEELKAAGGHTLALDITNDEQIHHIVEQIIDEQGRIDVLFNNAALGIYGAVEHVDLEEARRQFETNVFGLGALTKKVLPFMREQGSGTIINTTSTGGNVYQPFGAWYHATKHAVTGWSNCLRLEVAPFNINVVLIQPGLIETELGGIAYAGLSDYSQESAYGDMAQQMVTAAKNNSGKSSSPEVIAKEVVKAVEAKRPKTRYSAGKIAHLFMFMSKWFGDRVVDKVIMSNSRP